MTVLRSLIVGVSVLSFLFSGCGQRRHNMKTPEITSESEEGFHDLVFSIQDHKKLPDGSQVIRAEGLYEGKPVGLDVVLSPGWGQTKLDKDIPIVTHTGKVTYRTIGGESDWLLQILDRLYGTKLSPKEMGNETTFTGISLGGDPNNLASGIVKIKMFFEPGPEDRYAELYTNIDLNAGKLHIDEKDPEYRSAIIHALQSP